MRTKLAVASAAVALAAIATPTFADHRYTGGCRVDATRDSALGGQQSHTGTITIDVVAETLDPVSVRCDLYRNGALIAYDALSASGTGVAFHTARVQYAADPEDVIGVCALVSIGEHTTYDCDDTFPIGVPEPVQELLPPVTSPVVGYVFIEQPTAAPPTYQLWGALADPTLWSCSDNGSAVPYAVTCEPQPNVVLGWKCDVLHADITTLSAGARARTELDCNGDGVPEAATRVAQGIDHDWMFAPSDVLVTRFTCTISDGAGGATVPSLRAGCGDPGVPTIE